MAIFVYDLLDFLEITTYLYQKISLRILIKAKLYYDFITKSIILLLTTFNLNLSLSL